MVAKKKVAPVTFQGEVGSGDYRRALVAMRDRLAADMVEAPPAVVAQIAGRLQAVLAELESLPDGKAVNFVDDLAAQRRARIAGSAAGVVSG